MRRIMVSLLGLCCLAAFLVSCGGNAHFITDESYRAQV